MILLSMKSWNLKCIVTYNAVPVKEDYSLFVFITHIHGAMKRNQFSGFQSLAGLIKQPARCISPIKFFYCQQIFASWLGSKTGFPKRLNSGHNAHLFSWMIWLVCWVMTPEKLSAWLMLWPMASWDDITKFSTDFLL